MRQYRTMVRNCAPEKLEIPRCAIAHLRSGANAPSRNDGVKSRRVLQPLQRLENLLFLRNSSLALLFLFLDDLVGRVGDELLVGEFGVDALDVGVGLGDFLVEPGLFYRQV